jgi:hypothetical protein
MNGRDRRKCLKQMASGATQTVGRHPDFDATVQASARAYLRGDPLVSLVLLA